MMEEESTCPTLMADSEDGNRIFMECTDNGEQLIHLHHLGSQAVVNLRGARVISYISVSDQLGVIWTPPPSEGEGGIPIVWPWFGAHPEGDRSKPFHGFVKNRMWSIRSSKVGVATACEPVTIILGTSDDESTMQLFGHSFDLTLSISLADRLTLVLKTSNKGIDEFHITAGFHTYFNVKEVDSISIEGLDGAQYIDFADEKQAKVQHGSLTCTGEMEVNRIYSSGSTCEIRDPKLERKICISKQGSQSTVVWSPWIQDNTELSEHRRLENERFHGMVCVETANCGDSDVVYLQPGQSVELIASISSSPI
uniref:glucose-6-phosphate 1-epimerase n=1 Tax=Heterosigma akashiwo TaxID=2829 RepID=A0A6V1R801_HETAK